jgi:hypothetical protein
MYGVGNDSLWSSAMSAFFMISCPYRAGRGRSDATRGTLQLCGYSDRQITESKSNVLVAIGEE